MAAAFLREKWMLMDVCFDFLALKKRLIGAAREGVISYKGRLGLQQNFQSCRNFLCPSDVEPPITEHLLPLCSFQGQRADTGQTFTP